jgi:hypothetical protein
MNQGIERRLRKLEKEYAVRLGSSRVVGMRFLTEAEIERGVGPGLHDDDLSECSGAIDSSFPVPDLSSGPLGV